MFHREKLRQNKAILFQANTLIPSLSEGTLKPDIEYLPALKVYYQSINTDYANQDIETLWSKLMSWGFPKNGTDYYGVIADEPLITEKIKCRYDACASLPTLQKSLPHKTIFSGKYAKFLHFGSYETIEDTYAKIYANWILSTKLEFSPSPIIEQLYQTRFKYKPRKRFRNRYFNPTQSLMLFLDLSILDKFAIGRLLNFVLLSN